MAHINHTAHRKGGHTPPEWLRIGAEISTLANAWAARYDLVAYVGPGAGGPAPACYSPALAEIEVNVTTAFGPHIKPEDIGTLTDRSTQYEYARACGAIRHEAYHARYSGWDMETASKDLKRDEFDALVLLEEGRIEAFGVKDDPTSRVFLRACAMDIVIGDAKEHLNEDASLRGLTNLVGLVYPRIFAGILDADEMADLTDLIEEALGFDLVESLCALIRKAQAHDMHTHIEPLYPVAREWARLVREATSESEEPGEPGEGGESGDEGEGEGDGPGKAPKFSDEEIKEIIAEALARMEDAAEEVAINNNDDLADQEQAEAWEGVVNERRAEADERKTHTNVASKVFARPREGGRSSGSRLHRTRAPLPSERAAAVQVARALDRAKYRERDVTETRSVLPPGRLRTRAMVQDAANRAQGRMTQVDMWQRKARKHTDEPTLTVGIMVDISGSMGSAMEPMATTAWVMSEAGYRVQAKTAMVYYGSAVFPTLKPGERQSEVRIYTAPDGTEKFDEAFCALDGSLNLLYGAGARLLVVVSDGCYTAPQIAAAKKWVKRCEEAGVGVLWLPFDHGHYAREILSVSSTASLVAGTMDPAAAAAEIGRAAAESMTKIGRRAG